MENKYKYFKRDISWLSFNYRVLLEALDERLPLYERINFISIYSSNLEEFYKIRVADHKAVASGATESDEESVQSARELVEEINREVNRQLDDRVRIYEQKILPALQKNHIIFYQDSHVEPFHQQFIKDFFKEEIFPYLQPVPVSKDKIVSFLRDNRLYLAIRLYPKEERKESPILESSRPPLYFVMKQPYAKVPRFIELPCHEKNHYLMFVEDIIKANLDLIFPGYDVESCYSIKISRDADILIDDTASSADLVAQLKKKVKKRKIGDVCRFVYDRAMPHDFLDFLVDAFHIHRDELVPGDKHLNLEDLRHLPNPSKSLHSPEKPKPMKLTILDEKESIFNYVARKDLLLYYPYHSFEHFIHFLYEAVHNPETREIMVTQYRVAENSAVINTLIAAAQNGKKVTVFVELKARFDEENNLATAEMMQAAGIKIIYSIPGLKVHAKVALIRRRGLNGEKIPSYAYISTGNFNEKTATLYADCGLFTCRKEIVNDLYNLFRTLQGKEDPKFTTLLVARFNLIPELNRLIDREIALADQGKPRHDRPPLRSLRTRCADRPYHSRNLLPHPRPAVQPQHPHHPHRRQLPGTRPHLVLRQRRQSQSLHGLTRLDAPQPLPPHRGHHPRPRPRPAQQPDRNAYHPTRRQPKSLPSRRKATKHIQKKNARNPRHPSAIYPI